MATLDTHDGEQVVEALAQGGPAQLSGEVQTGDNLQTIDGAPVANMTDRKHTQEYSRHTTLYSLF